MQAWAPYFTSLSGFLGFFTSLWVVIIDENQVANYYGMSQASFNRQPANAGKFLGLWCRDLWGVELQDSVIEENYTTYGAQSEQGNWF